MSLGRSGAKSALLHKQFNNMTAQQEVFPATAMGVVYGFLVEEPSNNPLYIHFLPSGGTISSPASQRMSFECSSKFGRDGQPYAMKNFPSGCDVVLSTSRTAITAPPSGTTVHVWFESNTK